MKIEIVLSGDGVEDVQKLFDDLHAAINAAGYHVEGIHLIKFSNSQYSVIPEKP